MLHPFEQLLVFPYVTVRLFTSLSNTLGLGSCCCDFVYYFCFLLFGRFFNWSWKVYVDFSTQECGYNYSFYMAGEMVKESVYCIHLLWKNSVIKFRSEENAFEFKYKVKHPALSFYLLYTFLNLDFSFM